MAPQAIIDEVKASELRGRGGGGYPPGRKWEQCAAAPGDERYVICNADEGDPGAYMDRSLLEGNPHSVLEGMMIGAYAIGSGQGFVYVRKEYPLAVLHIQRAVEQARECGLLGQNILGTDFSFDVVVVRGGGAFVCGESTALMASLEGRVGEPRAKDVHTVEKGYLDQPTALNNVETWANVPKIILDGAAAFAALGTEGGRGTKIFALTGQIKNTGLVEVDMGTTIQDVVFGIGGGPKEGRTIKAVQTGGPSGGCLPASEFHLPLDFDRLYEAGSMMGSGGMVVLDDTACMVDVSKYFLTFLQEESCGKCAPCRVGVSRMLEIVTDFCEGRGEMEQLDLLEDLAWTVSVTSLCALGKTAANPVLSTLKYFRDEFEAHIKDKHCPAFVCRSLFRYYIDPDTCANCEECQESCPTDAISEGEGMALIIDDAICTRCGLCEEVCPCEAISKLSGVAHG
jgi:NADH-quinone oxidoreductase subunit F